MRIQLLSLLLLLLTASLASAAEVDVPQLIADAPGVDQFADQDIVVLWQDETVTVDADGRVTRHVHRVQRLQTQWAMRSRSDVRVSWDSSNQDLEVITARTFMKDGTEVKTPDNGFNEVTPDGVGRAVPMLDIREMVISHVGTEPGCVTDIDYVIRDREPGPQPVSGISWLGGPYPVLQASFHLDGAQGAASGLASPTMIMTESAGQWSISDLPAIDLQGTQDHRHDQVPHVVWSTAPNRDQLARSLRGLTEAAAGAATGLEGWLATTKKDPTVLTDIDLLHRIQDLIHAGIAGVHPPTGTWQRQPRLAEDVYNSGVGTDWERAIVGLTMLRLAGLEPEIGFFGRDALAENIPAGTARFNRWRLVVRLGDDNWWLAPDQGEAWTGQGDLGGWSGLFLGADGTDRFYTVRPQQGICRWTTHINHDGNLWQATGDLVLEGPYRPHGREARQVAEQIAAILLENGEVADLEIREETAARLSLRLTATSETLGEIKDGIVVHELPWPTGAVLDHLPAGFRSEQLVRQAPLWIDQPGRQEITIRMDLPAGWSLDKGAFTEVQVQFPQGSVHATRRIDGSSVSISQTLELQTGKVEPGDYPALQEALMTAQQIQRQPMIILVD